MNRLSNRDFQKAKKIYLARRRSRSWNGGCPESVRVAYGLPDKLDRLRSLGNAVVPKVAEWIGRRIMKHCNP